MSVFVVTWNLNRERSNYDQARREFLKRLEAFENIGDSGLETVRFVSTAQSAQQLSDDLRKAMDANDRLFVSRLRSAEHGGWLGQNVWDWINRRL